MKQIVLLLIASVSLQCTDRNKSESGKKKEIDLAPQQKSDSLLLNHNIDSETDPDQLKSEVSRLNGATSIKKIKSENGKFIITYVKNYKEYKELNPQSGLKENDLKLYWSTGSTIQKTLVGSPARLMKKFNFINEIEIILPFQNKIYQIDVKRAELEKFVGKSISEIENDWINSFADPYIYDQKGREQFLRKFGTIKNRN
ncbi:hypothetical protein SD427_14100 [Chryseobacterium sp. JJR-5R]|uniref:hypothetical protein n=1 Tax=Chryseobacterium sp. JJR-5R TaxID=3093923 RepID=UPI002A748BA4|nr:hypothetical protein [Chryseobacterium sp. JJR-5R]WPO81892.1 hypothetical protein SD427_14100 [Chryseobacterium sp. JJR-5R]